MTGAMLTRPGLYAAGLLDLFRGVESTEADAASYRVASCLVRIEHALMPAKGRR